MSRASRMLFGLAIVLGLSLWANQSRAAGPLVIHEWGTFTALQDRYGSPIGGINVDDEPLPQFVHNLNRFILIPPNAISRYMSKGVPERYPFVSLRLETPVVYFHPPKDMKLPLKLDVDVAMHGGWLTQFYPDAVPEAPGLKQDRFEFGPITNDTVGRLGWHNLTVGTSQSGPETDANVWLAPRSVDAASVQAASGGEAEKYLFYRGVGNFSAPLSISTDQAHNRLQLHSHFEDVLSGNQTAKIGRLWLVHVRKDGTSAFRSIGPVTAVADHEKVIGEIPASFSEKDFSLGNLASLCDELHAALVKDGLYKDEATALVETWRQAYFKSAGLRVFFLVPRVWTDHRLSFHVSVPAKIERVMVGRIELVSPEQKELLDKLSTMPISSPEWVSEVRQSPNAIKFFSGHSDFGDLGVKIPDDYQVYLDLGRFRNALVLERARRQPSDSLAKFINNYDLQSFDVENARAN